MYKENKALSRSVSRFCAHMWRKKCEAHKGPETDYSEHQLDIFERVLAGVVESSGIDFILFEDKTSTGLQTALDQACMSHTALPARSFMAINDSFVRCKWGHSAAPVDYRIIDSDRECDLWEGSDGDIVIVKAPKASNDTGQ